MGFIPGGGPRGGTNNDFPATSTTIPPTRPSETGDLLVQITATVVIRNFSKYYPGESVRGFEPQYTPLADGSLISPPLTRDLVQVHAILIICSALFVFFFRNTFTVLRYIRSGKVPQKALFYVFLGSQVIGFVFPLPALISIFAARAGCRAIEIVSTITNFLSLSLLVTGILGVKAYRCLDSSKVVLVGLVFLRTASVAFMILDLINLEAERRLGGTCIRSSQMTYVAGTAASQLGELVFISCCFAWGFWKANGSRPGRLTVPITPILPDTPNFIVGEDPRRRGWWDYIPDDPNNPSKGSEIVGSEGAHSVFGGSTWHSDQLTKQRKPSLHTVHPLSQPTREFGRRPQFTSQLSTYALSLTASSFVSKFGLQIKTFKNLLRNELAFTSVVTLLQGATSVLAVLNTDPESFFPAYCLSMITWVTISQLLLLTFDRVIRRHEKEVVLQTQGLWEPARREVRDVFRVPTTRESSLLSRNSLAFPDNVTYRSAKTASSIASDPFRSRRSSWSSRMGSRRSYTEREISSRLDPMFEKPIPGTTPSMISSYLHPSESLPPSPAPSSPRSIATSSTHILPKRNRGNGW